MKFDAICSKLQHNTKFKLTLWPILVLALVVVRELLPEVAESFSEVYIFIDNVILPVVNWAYAIVMKCVNALDDVSAIRDIIQWLANLAL